MRDEPLRSNHQSILPSPLSTASPTLSSSEDNKRGAKDHFNVRTRRKSDHEHGLKQDEITGSTDFSLASAVSFDGEIHYGLVKQRCSILGLYFLDSLTSRSTNMDIVRILCLFRIEERLR